MKIYIWEFNVGSFELRKPNTLSIELLVNLTEWYLKKAIIYLNKSNYVAGRVLQLGILLMELIKLMNIS